MKDKDNLTILIDTLLKIIKEYALMETSDGKYSIYLKKESIDTISGKSYDIIITERQWSDKDE